MSGLIEYYAKRRRAQAGKSPEQVNYPTWDPSAPENLPDELPPEAAAAATAPRNGHVRNVQPVARSRRRPSGGRVDGPTRGGGRAAPGGGGEAGPGGGNVDAEAVSSNGHAPARPGRRERATENGAMSIFDDAATKEDALVEEHAPVEEDAPVEEQAAGPEDTHGHAAVEAEAAAAEVATFDEPPTMELRVPAPEELPAEPAEPDSATSVEVGEPEAVEVAEPQHAEPEPVEAAEPEVASPDPIEATADSGATAEAEPAAEAASDGTIHWPPRRPDPAAENQSPARTDPPTEPDPPSTTPAPEAAASLASVAEPERTPDPEPSSAPDHPALVHWRGTEPEAAEPAAAVAPSEPAPPVAEPEPEPAPATPEPAPAPVFAPAAEARLGFRERGRLRRRARYLRHLREVQLRDLGGFVLELHRFEVWRGDLVGMKIAEVAETDRELRVLEAVLSEQRSLREVREAGLGGSCRRCGTIYGSLDHFCAACGAPLTARTAQSAVPARPQVPVEPRPRRRRAR